jgi:uncharacterized protein YdhG (YjbR/CyaY superfamily)
MDSSAAAVDHYLSTFPPQVQLLLEQIRATIRQQVPGAQEKMSYGIAAFFMDGQPVLYYAGFKKHVSVYPVPREHEDFKAELAAYQGGRGTAQFPLDQPLPLDLIARLAQFWLRENQEKLPKKRQQQQGAFAALPAPARRALEARGITHPQQLAELTEPELLALHGMGKVALAKLREILSAHHLDFKK